ncbi:lipopolysaccharide-induced tumor necrosis factor-alpha factor homolog [Galleria mellonella]|uniref:Lipopolysaccharide-induced tumor necrosis factor-alpha factor homolog n=1 Tax=Galleria mellonella TaxID=7137 RepID=A0A6J1WIF9_GALME|nr:lipopolysaccharide-induced tumor necrosis factor-alpha factor homolog [Galleria mellonella]
MGNKPSRIICRMCNQEMVTRIETNASLKTHLFALLLCGLGCWCCVCIPYFIDSCKKTNHYCTTCGAYIGFYN